jgi:hypothetical protein
MNSPVFARLAISITGILLGFTTSAQAGPPLICHPIEIGQAKSLPWVDWNQKGSGGYDPKNLARDTLAILDTSTPVLVRMETLRRATLYARQDPQVAKELLTRLHARAANAEAAGHPEALAWFDVGYLTETYKQWIGKGESNPATGLEGYGLIARARSRDGIRGCPHHPHGPGERSPRSRAEGDGRREGRSSSRSELGFKLQPSGDLRVAQRACRRT